MSQIIKYAFRITHIDNIKHIATSGLTRKDSPHHNEQFVRIGDEQIVKLRGERIVKGYRINDYIPFYLGPRSPMLYVIQHGYNGVQQVEPDKIIYCVVKIDDIIQSDLECIFTNGHALNAITSFFTKEQLSRLSEIVKYEDVNSVQWTTETDIDLKRRKEAELLVKNDIPVDLICGYVVYNEWAKDRLVQEGIDAHKIIVAPKYYF